MNKQNLSLIRGPIWKAMLLFALPVFLGNVFQQLYNAFDAWCVGNYVGDNALAAVSSSGSLIFMMICFFNGTAMGAGVVISRYFGAKHYAEMKKAIHTAIAFGLVAGVALTVLGVAFTPIIGLLVNTAGVVVELTTSYFMGYFLGGEFVERQLDKMKRGREYLEDDSRDSAVVMFFLRIIPIFSVNAISMFYGSSHYNYWKYLGISMAGMMPRVIVLSLFGNAIYENLPSLTQLVSNMVG